MVCCADFVIGFGLLSPFVTSCVNDFVTDGICGLFVFPIIKL